MRQGLERIGRDIDPRNAKRMCLDKKAFATRNEARDFAARGQKLFGNASLTPYRCQLCGNFHLTKLSKEDSTAVRSRVRQTNWERTR